MGIAKIWDIDGGEWVGLPEGVDELAGLLWKFGSAGVTPRAREEYFWKVVELAFNCEGSVCRVVRNGWADRMVRGMIGDGGKKVFVSLVGSSSSGKSHLAALYGLVSYWSRPHETWFFVMSTTKSGARGRIWKSVTELFAQAQRRGCPGKLLDSIGVIKGVNKLGNVSGNSGIKLLAAGKADADEACRELLGNKNPNVIVAADELPELGQSIIETANNNLSVNDRLAFIGMGNPNRITDPLGDLSEPIGGWKSVSEADEEWRTKYGMCLRFNAEKSPRIVEPDGEKYHWMPDAAYNERIAGGRGGKKSRGYYRYVKAFWCPDGAPNSIYGEVEVMENGGMDEEPVWDGEVVMLSALDPAFAGGGHRNQVAIGKVGKVGGLDRLHVCHYQGLVEDITDKKTPLSHQIVRQWRALSEEWGVMPSGAIMDATGSGISFGHIVDAEWSPRVQKVNFQSVPSDRQGRFGGEDCEYYNKNSELWIQPKEFLRGGQISGINTECLAELVEREFHSKEGRKLRVEGKDDAKKRIGRSPDIADSVLMLVEKAISIGAFRSEEKKKVRGMIDKGWRKQMQKRCLSTRFGTSLFASGGKRW
jgi:hypothetical protein